MSKTWEAGSGRVTLHPKPNDFFLGPLRLRRVSVAFEGIAVHSSGFWDSAVCGGDARWFTSSHGQSFPPPRSLGFGVCGWAGMYFGLRRLVRISQGSGKSITTRSGHEAGEYERISRSR